jgi:DNA polymerase III subunit delta
LLYILWGEDEFSRAEALLEIKKSLGDPAMLATNTTVLEGRNLTLNELKASVQAVPFLARARLVIVQGLLARFETAPKSAGVKKTNGGPKADDAAPFADCLKSLPPSTVLVLTDSIEVKKPFLQKNALFTAVAEKAEVKPFSHLKGPKLSQWIDARISRLGGSISRQANNLLMEAVGGDLYTLSHEIEKLAAYTAGRQIEEKDVRAVVSASQEIDIFTLIDAVMEHQAGPAETILQKLLQNGTAPPQILALIARQVRVLIQIKEMKALKRPVAEIQTAVGIFYPYIWDKTSRQAARYSGDSLKKIYLKLLNTDLAIKTGRFEGDLALDILVADLSLP